MDNENIAAILKDAINASSTKIQSESKRTKVFVLPPELLKGLLIKNEIPKKTDNNTTEAETSSPKNNKKTTTNKRQSSENSKSAATPVDRPKPKRASNRKSTANKDPKNTKSQKPSKSNRRGLKNVEQNHEQNVILENNEASDISKSVEKVTIQKKSNRGRKPKTKKENETRNEEKREDPHTILDKNQENSTEVTHEHNDPSINASSDEVLDNCSKEKCSVEISDKVEEKSTETNHELQDYSADETSSNIIHQDNLTNPEAVVSSCEKKLCDETVKVDDMKTEVIDQVLEKPHIEIFQSDASQKILNGEISSHIGLNNEKGVSDLSSEPTELPNIEETTIIEEETYIVEEIIEIVGSDEEQVSEEYEKTDKSEENNVQIDVLPVENTDLPNPISAPIMIKPEPISKVSSVNFEPIVEQKRSNTARVYVNKRKSRKKTDNTEVQERSIPQIKDNIDENSLITSAPKVTSLKSSCGKSLDLQKDYERSETDLDCNVDENNFTTIPKPELEKKFISEVNCDFGQDDFIDPVLAEAPVENFCEESQKDHQKSVPEMDCDYNGRNLTTISKTDIEEKIIPEESFDFGRNHSNDTVLTDTPVENIREEPQNSQKSHENSEPEIDCNYDGNNLTIISKTEIEEKIIPEENCNFDQDNFNDSVSTDTPVEDFREVSNNSLETSEEFISEKESKSDENCLTYIARTEITTKNQCQEITYFELQQQSNSEVDTSLMETLDSREELRLSQQVKEESSFDQSNSSDSASTENPNKKAGCSPNSEEKIKAEMNYKIDHISLDTAEAETSKINSNEELKQEENIFVLENNITNDMEKTGNENEISVPIETLVASLQDPSKSAEETQSIDSVQETSDTQTTFENQTELAEIKTCYTRSQRKSASAKNDEEITAKTIKSSRNKMEIDIESTENTQSGELAINSADSNVKNDVKPISAVSAGKTDNSCKNNDFGDTKSYWENEQNSSIRSLRQLRNRTKVIPQDPENFNKLKNYIEKESLQLRNSGKSDIIVRYDFDCSKRTRSVSLNLVPNSPEKLSGVAKKLSRKPKSTDNYLEKASRMIALRRRSGILQNEIKLPPVLEDSNKIQSKEILNSETVECEKSKIDSNQTNIGKTIVYASTIDKGFESTIIQKDDQVIASDSNLNETNLNETSSCNIYDSLNLNSTETDIDRNNSSLKREKVIVVRKIKKGRRSKSSQPKDDSADPTDEQKSDNKINKIVDISKMVDNTVSWDNEITNNILQLEMSKTAENKNLLEDSVEAKTNCSSIDSSNCQGNIAVEEAPVNIKREKVTPIKRSRRRTLAKPNLPKNIRAEISQDDLNVNKISENEMESADRLRDLENVIVNSSAPSNSQKADEISESTPTVPSNADSQVEEVLEDSTLTIKTEKISPVKRGRRGRRPKFISPNVDEEDSVANNKDIDENAILPEDNVDNSLECSPVDPPIPDKQIENEESILEIKTEKVAPVRRGRRGRRPNFISSNVDPEDPVANNKEIDENAILPKDNVDNSLECIPVDPPIPDKQVENEESILEIKTEKVAPVIRGRRGRRPKSMLSRDNTIKNNDDIDVPEDILPKDSILTNQIVISAEIHEHVERTRVSDDLDDKLKADRNMEKSSARNSSEMISQKLPPVKKGKRGRRPKFSRIDVNTKETDVAENDRLISIAENDIDLQENEIIQVEEVDKTSIAEKSVDSDMEIDTTIGDDNADDDSDLDTIDTDDKIKENSGKRSKLRRRNSRHSKQESSASNSYDTQTSPKDNVEKIKRQSRRSSNINVKRDIVDSDDEPKNKGKDSSNMSLRKSGRRQKSNVNYCVPDEDVDVYDSEQRIAKEPSENAPKKRRGRPSKKDLLMRLNASTEEKPEQNLQESIQKDTSLNAAVNDVDSSPADVSNTSTRKRRSTNRSTIDEDIFEVESESKKESVDTPDQSQAETLSDAADDTNDFEDSHISDKSEEEEEDIVEDYKPRRGRKRKYSFITHTTIRKRGRPPLKKKVRSNDDDYAPHHSYVPRPTKVKEKSKEAPSKKIVKCGKCGKEVPKNQWYSHNLYSHNDMGWLDGAEKPDFENDSKLLMRVLTAAHKKKNKKGLVCESCREVKKSVVGFISHMTFCGKTDAEIESLLVTCDQCGGKFKPSSMEYHERQHRLEIEGKKKKEKALAEKEIDIFGPRSKRKAAEKAVSKISEFTAQVKDDEGCSAAKKLKLSSPHIKKFIQKPLATKKISSLLVARWKRELDNNQDAACTQLGCQFACKSMDEIREHYATCNYTVTENYVCKVCRYQTLSADEIIKHAAEKHTSEDLDINAAMSDAEASESEDYSDYDEDASNKSQGLVKKFFYKETSEIDNKMFKFIFNNGTCHTVLNKTFIPGFQWTLEFERKHFKFSIFNDFTPSVFSLLKEQDAESYLPELDLSLPVKFMNKDGRLNEPEWKKWSRFEASRVDDCPTLFVGGPVWAMAWAPTPSYLAISDDLPQFLAVSTHPNMDIEYSVGESYSGKNIIQIWNVGKLNNRNASESDPVLSYAIAHEGGTVWSLEWCPSGCYQHEDFPDLKNGNDRNRLGLLAAGCSDGCVRIYSLVFPQDLVHSPNENQYPIYKTEPVIQLIISSDMYENNEQNWQVMKLNWSRESNHNIIVAGLSNGYVALWDLTTKSPMLKYKVKNTTFIRPYRQFFAHHHAVTMVTLVPRDNKRYLATASLDKLYKFWDLEDISRPKNTYKKSYVTDGAWFNNWCCAVIVHDNALCTNGNNSAVCLPLRNYTYKYYNILPSNSTIYGLSTSDFGNSVATGNVAGELLTIFPHQLIYIRDMEKTIPPKRSCSLVSTTELVDFDAEQDKSPVKRGKKPKSEPYSDPTQFMPSTYKDSEERFGILFNNKINPLKSNSKSVQKYKKKPTLTCEQLEQTPIEQYPLKSINKVAWNPNASSFLWLAAGYQNGFVRLFSFRSVASTVEWNKLLQLHTNALKAQMDQTGADDSC